MDGQNLFGALNFQSTTNLRSVRAGRQALKYVAVLVIGLVLLLLYAEITSRFGINIEYFGGVAVVLWLIVPVAAAISYENRADKHNRTYLEKFAADNGFKFESVSSAYEVELKPGSLFHIGVNKRAENVLRGESSGLKFNLFGYFYLYKSPYSYAYSTYSPYHMATVMEIYLPAQYRHLVVDSLVEEGSAGLGKFTSALPIEFSDDQRLDLEGEFSRFFAVYAAAKQETPAYGFLTPDIMQGLIGSAQGCDIEIINDRLYIYWAGDPRLKDYASLFASVNKIWGVIGKKLLDANTQAIINEPVRCISQSDTNLKQKKLATYALAMQLFVALFVVLQALTFFVFIAQPGPKVESLINFIPVFLITSLLAYVIYRLLKNRQIKTMSSRSIFSNPK